MSIADLGSCIFFFFSSRRRHTRFDCDWSSDVCSSDLAHAGGIEQAHDDRQDLVPRHAAERQVAPEAAPQTRQCVGERGHPLELLGVTEKPPPRMITILL